MAVSTGPPRPPPEERESGRALPKLILAAALLTLGVALLAMAVNVYAIFTGSTSVPNNDFASDTLDPASGLGATGGASADLSWTATAVDTYASGHHVLRGTTSGGPYSQIAEVTPLATETYTDTPAPGTYYYVVRTFYQNWESVNSNEASATVSGGCVAGDTGFLNPTAQAADTGGDGDGFELNPTDAFADGVASASNIDGDDDNHRFYNYGISIPAGCVIAGIEVRLDWWLDAIPGNNKVEVDLSWDGGTSWTVTKPDSQEPTTETTVILGGSADAWSRIWTIAELSDANFRVRVATRCSGNAANCNPRDYFLDWVPVQVTYTP